MDTNADRVPTEVLVSGATVAARPAGDVAAAMRAAGFDVRDLVADRFDDPEELVADVTGVTTSLAAVVPVEDVEIGPASGALPAISTSVGPTSGSVVR